MRTGKELILATKPFAREFTGWSWFHVLSTFVLLFGSMALALFFDEWIIRIPASVFAGFCTVRFFVIYHDYLHGAILSKSLPGKMLFHAFGIFVLAPPSIWKRSHDYHHNHNSKLFSASIGSYPIMTLEKFHSSSSSEKRAYLLSRHPLTIFLGYFSMFMIGMCVRSLMNAPKKHYDSLIALILHAAINAAVFIFLGWKAWLFGITIPFLIASMIGAYLFYAQHNFPGVKFKDKEGWTYHGAALESSSYMEMNIFWRWVTANIGYHHIHHLNARIPFYRLPETMAAIPELQNPPKTSLKPSAIAACFRIKVWDPVKNEMVPVG
jgi:acyl-lipid omega-6 desaturase (Delta-12 desaturase)